ncbi:hypothetical protein GKC56_03680 [Neisseriaceae bacterium PsAf]|nr:hypothetical protein [Neisseriaceae bacterium PsAf]
MFRKNNIIYLLLLLPTFIFAHPGHLGSSNFITGFMHPLTGLDHLLAMLTVGIWASFFSGSIKWALPISFVGMMTFGFIAGMNHVQLPLLETVIVFSVICLGFIIAIKAKPSLSLAIATVGVFGFYHGVAHGQELVGSSANSFALGFILSTMLLHILGIFAGSILSKNNTILQTTGGVIVLIGMGMMLS